MNQQNFTQLQHRKISPIHHDICWVTPANLDVSKIFLSDPIQSQGTDFLRYKVLYRYDESPPSDLYLTIQKDPSRYLRFGGIRLEKSNFIDANPDVKRRTCLFELQHDNAGHVEFYNAIVAINNKVSGFVEGIPPFKVTTVSGNKSLMFTRLIEGNDSQVYTTAYTVDNQLDILEISGGLVRPAFLFSVSKIAENRYSKLKVQLAQMYVHEITKEFPLAYKD